MADANLIDGVRNLNVQGVKMALNAGANPNTEFNSYTSYTVLCWIIEGMGSEDLAGPKAARIVDLLLKAGADPNLKTCGQSPLEFAAESLYRFYRDEKDRYINRVEYEKSQKEILDLLCPVTDTAIVEEVREKYPEIVDYAERPEFVL
jgi:hypothetical protein